SSIVRSSDIARLEENTWREPRATRASPTRAYTTRASITRPSTTRTSATRASTTPRSPAFVHGRRATKPNSPIPRLVTWHRYLGKIAEHVTTGRTARIAAVADSHVPRPSRTAPWLRAGDADRNVVGGRPPGRGRLALPRAPPAGGSRLDQGPVEQDRKRTARQDLRHHRR